MPIDLRTEVAQSGFAFLSRFRPGEATSLIIEHLGAVAPLPALDDVQQLKPKAASQAPPNIYSGTFGLGDFPLHSDLAHWFLPPRYFVLRCVSGTNLVRTTVLDGRRLIEAFGETRLRRCLVQPRRPVGLTKPILRILDRDLTGDHRLRWDSLFLRPATASSASVFDAVRTHLRDAPSISITLACPDDTLVIDNWRVLHGRTAVGPESIDRTIERVYLRALA